jgi:hypothetical protein
MNQIEVIPVLEDEDSILAQTHAVRKAVVGELFKDGKLPSEPDDRKLLLATLKDMDASALGRKRIKVDEKQNNNQEAARGLIAQLLQAAAGKKPYQAEIPVEREIPVLGMDIPDPALVEGETSTTYVQETVEMFRNRMQ